MKPVKVMCFGTFDLLHKGHLSYFKQAKKYGDILTVIIARDNNVLKIKGKLPKDNEKERKNNVESLKIVDQTILGNSGNKFGVISKYSPDVLCLGYDQIVDIEKLKKIFKGKIVRLKPYQEHKYKSSKIRHKHS